MNIVKTTALAAALVLSTAVGAFAQNSGADSSKVAPLNPGETQQNSKMPNAQPTAPMGSGMGTMGSGSDTTGSVTNGPRTDGQDSLPSGGANSAAEQKACPQGQTLVKESTQTEPAVCR